MEEDEFLFADGFDNAVMGVASRAGQPDVMAYDYKGAFKSWWNVTT